MPCAVRREPITNSDTGRRGNDDSRASEWPDHPGLWMAIEMTSVSMTVRSASGDGPGKTPHCKRPLHGPRGNHPKCGPRMPLRSSALHMQSYAELCRAYWAFLLSHGEHKLFCEVGHPGNVQSNPALDGCLATRAVSCIIPSQLTTPTWLTEVRWAVMACRI